MSEFRVGEIVDITIKGVRVGIKGVDGHPRRLYVDLGPWDDGVSSGSEWGLTLPMGIKDTLVTVERAAPANWPPQQGDVWRDGKGGHWFAYHFGRITMVGEGGSQVGADLLLGTGAPLTLAYRRESDGGGS